MDVCLIEVFVYVIRYSKFVTFPFAFWSYIYRMYFNVAVISIISGAPLEGYIYIVSNSLQVTLCLLRHLDFTCQRGAFKG